MLTKTLLLLLAGSARAHSAAGSGDADAEEGQGLAPGELDIDRCARAHERRHVRVCGQRRVARQAGRALPAQGLWYGFDDR